MGVLFSIKLSHQDCGTVGDPCKSVMTLVVIKGRFSSSADLINILHIVKESFPSLLPPPHFNVTVDSWISFLFSDLSFAIIHFGQWSWGGVPLSWLLCPFPVSPLILSTF